MAAWISTTLEQFHMGEHHAIIVAHGVPPRILFASYFFVLPEALNLIPNLKSLLVNLNPPPLAVILAPKISHEALLHLKLPLQPFSLDFTFKHNFLDFWVVRINCVLGRAISSSLGWDSASQPKIYGLG